MAILSFPTGLRAPSSVSGPGLRANTQSGGVSPFDGTEQTLEMPGARWQAELRYDRLRESEWRKLQAFLGSLHGRAGRFYWGPSGFQPRRGTDTAVYEAGGDVPRIKTAGQTGSWLETTGWAGAGMPFREGDWLQWASTGGHTAFHMVTADVGAVDRTSQNLQLHSCDLFNAAFTTALLTNVGATFIAGSTAYWPGGCYTRIVARASAGFAYLRHTSAIAVTGSSYLTCSILARLVSGTCTAGNLLRIDEYAGGTLTRTTLGPALSSVTGTMTKYQNSILTRSDTTTILVYYLLDLDAGTFELQWPQVEYGSPATATILTDTTATTRLQSVWVPITPQIRRATSADVPLEYRYAQGTWRLSQDVVVPDFSAGAGPIANFTIPIEEAIW